MMKRMKKIIGKIVVIMMLCFAIGSVVSAAESASTEVQIAIEGTEQKENVLEKTDIPGPKTGDESLIILYVIGVVIATIIAGVCIWKKKKIGIAVVLAMLVSGCFFNHALDVSASSNNFNLTVPSSMGITFHEDGSQTIEPFEIQNNSNLPVHIQTVNVEERNEWSLVPETETISKDKKELVFMIESQCLHSGRNTVNISIQEHTKKEINIEVKRGAWSDTKPAETAMNLEFEYTFQNKQFQITFDSNGGSSVAPIKAFNDEKVSLPIPTKAMCVFKGWQDEDGQIYHSDYVMPARDVILKAVWNGTDAYAIYSADDKSLTFVRSETPIQAGTTYNGKKVTSVYTGFETESYTSTTLPWMKAGGNYGGNIVKVVVEDVIQPVSTAYWFYCIRDCTYLELSKLDMSKVTDMTSMFSSCGCDVTGSVILTGISDWDTSNVVKMGTVFRGIGEIASVLKIDDISKWNTSNVTDMLYMFFGAGKNADWTLDLRNWDVRNVVEHKGFDEYAETKVLEPIW